MTEKEGGAGVMTENELLTELIAELAPEPIRPDEVTTSMLADATGLTTKAAANRLEKGVREGVLEWRWVRVGNCRAKAYSKAVQE